jgi:hypothetical protein
VARRLVKRARQSGQTPVIVVEAPTALDSEPAIAHELLDRRRRGAIGRKFGIERVGDIAQRVVADQIGHLERAEHRNEGTQHGLHDLVELERVGGADVYEVKHFAQQCEPQAVPEKARISLPTRTARRSTCSQKRIVVATVSSLVRSPFDELDEDDPGPCPTLVARQRELLREQMPDVAGAN